MSDPSYLLQWKGRQSGPYSLAQIRALLTRGEISRLHQVAADGRWQVLDEFLAQQPEEQAQRLAAGQSQPSTMESSPQENSARSPLSHLLPKQPQPAASAVFPPQFEPEPEIASGPSRTSGMAIAALVLALCNFIPYLNFISWILSLVFGHTALVQMNRDPALAGRGMAIAGLIITYFLLIMVLTLVVLLVANGERIPFF